MRDGRPVAKFRLTDFDYVVLAAARIGALRIKQADVRNGYPIYGVFMGDKRVEANLKRLQKARELSWFIVNGQLTILFPDTVEWLAAEEFAARIIKWKRSRGLV